MEKNTKIYVKVELLQNEKEFWALCNFMRSSKSSELNDFDCIDYSLDGRIMINSGPSIPEGCVMPPELLAQWALLSNGYIFLTVDSLLKLLCLNS